MIRHHHQTEIIVLSGFLGSGKSTLLQQLLQKEKELGRNVAVFLNEFGDQSIDFTAVPENTLLKELLNGCICCTIQGQLSHQLDELLKERPLDAVYIEATGVAHPVDVINACTHPFIADQVNIKAVITMVDTKQWIDGKGSIKVRKLMKEQVKYADIIILNKKGKISHHELVNVHEEVAQLNPKAKRIDTNYAVIDFSLLFIESTFSSYSKWERPSNHDVRVDEDLHLHSITLPILKPISRLKFSNWVNTFQSNIYRMKGFVVFTNSPEIVLLNYSHGGLALEPYLQRRNVTPVLVMIGEDLQKDRIKHALQTL
ncbi:CobW family GTP-binding protein [Alteribacillus sp. HJP-4]|uniref:CobW family GTP-binding protein n=1 Tax=Alteribacillus sp. HJP-4 TaxID=2775394 RepID=UPI0035CD0A21